MYEHNKQHIYSQVLAGNSTSKLNYGFWTLKIFTYKKDIYTVFYPDKNCRSEWCKWI